MKKVNMIFAGLLLALTVQAQSTELPGTEIKDLKSGKKIAFNEVHENGKVTLVSFWATWCVPCKKEIKNIREQMAEVKAEADFDFVTVSIDESRAEGLVRSYAKSQGWDFPYYIDPNSDLKRSLNFQTVPFTIIIGKDGKIAYMHAGYEEGGEHDVFERIKALSKG